VYIFFKLLNRLLFKRPLWQGTKTRFDFGRGPRPVSEMVQDPVCKIYVPKREALTAEQDGATYYFCSKECRQKFKDRNA